MTFRLYECFHNLIDIETIQNYKWIWFKKKSGGFFNALIWGFEFLKKRISEMNSLNPFPLVDELTANGSYDKKNFFEELSFVENFISLRSENWKWDCFLLSAREKTFPVFSSFGGVHMRISYILWHS